MEYRERLEAGRPDAVDTLRRILVVRTAGEPSALLPLVEQELRALDPALPVSITTHRRPTGSTSTTDRSPSAR